MAEQEFPTLPPGVRFPSPAPGNSPEGYRARLSLAGSVYAHEFVDAAVLGQAGVDIALRVDADAVDMAALHPREYISLSVADADLGGLAVVFLLGDVEIAVPTTRDVVGAAHAGPLAKILAVRREYLDALVRPVPDIELAGIVESDGVRQVELARATARLTPGFDEPSIACEAVYARVAVAVGHVDVAVGMGDHLGRVIERPRRALRQPVGNFAGVRMPAARSELQQRLAVEGERLRDRVGAVGRVDRVADNFEAMRVGDLTAAPSAEVFAVAVENHDRRVLALEHINAVLRIGRYAADQPEGLPGGQFAEIVDQLVGVFACADLCHCCLPPVKTSDFTMRQ